MKTTASAAVATTVYDTADANKTWDGSEVAGASAYDTATVTGGGGNTPTGTVTFDLYGNGTCTGSPITGPDTETLDEGGIASSLSTDPLEAGTYGYLASYSGDDNFDPSTGSCEPFTVLSNVNVTASLTAGSPTVGSVSAVPESALPSSTVESAAPTTGSGNAGAAPLRSIPLRSISLGAIPLRSIPLRSIPLRSIPAAARALSTTLLSDLPIEYPPGCSGTSCTGWAGILAGTPLAINPLQSTSLADVLADPTASARFETVPLSGLDVSATALASLPLAAIALAGAPLRSIALPGADGTATGNLTAWCTQLTSIGFDCATDFGINPANPSSADGVDILALSLAGVPLRSIPLRSIPLRSIDLSSSALASVPLRSINLTSSPLRSIPLRSIDLTASPLRSIPLRSIGDFLRASTAP